MPLPDASKLLILNFGLTMTTNLLNLAQRIGEWKSKAIAGIVGTLATLSALGWTYFVLLWVFQVDSRAWIAAHWGETTAAIVVCLASVGGAVFYGRSKRTAPQQSPPSTEPAELVGPMVLLETVTAAQFSAFEISSPDADVFEIGIEPLSCGTITVGWVLSRNSLRRGERASARVREIGKSGNFAEGIQGDAAIVYPAFALDYALNELTSAEHPVVIRSIFITYKDRARRSWQSECPVQYDKWGNRSCQFLTPIISEVQSGGRPEGRTRPRREVNRRTA